MSYKGKKGSKLVGVEEGYDLYADFYDVGRGGKKFLDSFERDVVKKMMLELENVDGAHILDVGCGTGRMIERLLEYGDVFGVDLSAEMVKKVQDKFGGRGVEAHKGDVEELEAIFGKEKFDAVFGMFLIVHLKTLDDAFRAVWEVLKPGGFFVVSNVNQRRAPVLKAGEREIVIDSYYHRPENVISSLEEAWFEVEVQEFVNEDGVWINQVVKARKSV